MSLLVAFKLGRVSNLPTVWTNTVAAIVLAGAGVTSAATPALLISMTLFYLGGMYLNDAFDADIDARERPERPIPAGDIARSSVFCVGFFLLTGGLALLCLAAYQSPEHTGVWPGVSGVILAGAIMFYNWHHKGNVLSPVVMGLCRLLIYVSVGFCFAVVLPLPLLIGAILLFSYLIGLTYVAKQENLGEVKNLWPLLFLAAPVIYGGVLSSEAWPTFAYWVIFVVAIVAALWLVRRRQSGDIPRAVVTLIAGMSLLDAILISGVGEPGLALVAVLGFALTLALQRVVSGT
jgi:4-hydroxybenzoate polyprenyltransferase